MNVVSNESTPFLIGLDVLREYGLVIDYHYSRVYNHILKRYLLCASLPTGHLALEMMPSSNEKGQHRVSSHAFSIRRWANNQGHRRKERFRLTRPQSLQEESEHEHGHTSTSEDDLLKLLGMPSPLQLICSLTVRSSPSNFWT